MNSLISPEEADSIIRSIQLKRSATSIPIDSSSGHYLAKPVMADRPFPPFDRSMMDGFATKKAFLTQASLSIAGTIPAGETPPTQTPNNSAWEIMTGAVVPDDCDIIIPIEQTHRIDSQHVKIDNQGDNVLSFIHKKGSDFEQGDELIPAFTQIKSREIAILASVGAHTPQVIQPPKITILTTGDEVVPIDQIPTETQIRQSNGIALKAALSKYPISDIRITHLGDSLESTKAECAKAIQSSDLILFTGGISKGKFDFVKPAIEAELGSPLFHGIAQKPGKPLALWHQQDTTVFALPGNPISVAITFHRYVTQFLNQWFQQDPPIQQVELLDDITIKKPLTHFIPVSLKAPSYHQASLHSFNNSGDLASCIATNGFVELPKNETFFPAGSFVNYFPWS